MSGAELLHVVLAGGGTGGHIEPALNLATQLRARRPDLRITALGTARGLEVDLIPRRGYDLELIPAVPLPRRPGRDAATLPVRLVRAVRATRDVLARLDADVVVGFGGYTSIPAYLAAWREHSPFVVHEANAKAGLANRIGARLTPFVAENYAGSLKGAVTLGCPLRPSIASLDRARCREDSRVSLGLDPDRSTLLVFGGSQGAERLNESVAGALPALLGAGIQVIHAVGQRNELPPTEPGYQPLAFIEHMDIAYAAADLAVCRAGAMTCAELTAVGLPAIYVPYAVGNGEQRFNAQPVVRAGGGLMVLDSEMNPDTLLRASLPLLREPARLEAMSSHASSYGIRDAAARLADMVEHAAGVI
ncbi:MAG: undecaprenyldiphospho-muramoylpentapeptide beta-N-acetylglucosaminyltransferase [Candidatus Nanopelagicales bacterium]|nr:undecaprenyldiphospho-muramoylpentapeptide beta-N-acetylglucosaminyltransferase [Candidatus Nanopelagicales bacterium]MDZ4248517.1 undecaprenyldiphospho-muramoylpentapeptide beta-N-acetylglucosaminyltransferase [Candidatus Nanopelagicales bacterium]MDZ7577893.1 undecaprenyldiphospho-muramoylpentapeptide beta-N-acetylglucosaminyltransferase [Candidatus Nanopelagicales bacterium]